MADIKTCSTCPHWKPYRERYPNNHSGPERNAGGLCDNPNLREDMDVEAVEYLPNRLVYPYNEGGKFWTGPDFGCIHHG